MEQVKLRRRPDRDATSGESSLGPSRAVPQYPLAIFGSPVNLLALTHRPMDMDARAPALLLCRAHSRCSTKTFGSHPGLRK